MNFIKHIFKQHAYPAISILLLIIVFGVLPKTQIEELKKESVNRIATLGAAFNRLARGNDTREPPYLASLSKTSEKISRAFAPSSNLALKKAISGGALAVGTDSKVSSDKSLFDIEIAPVEVPAESKTLPVFSLAVIILLVVILIIFVIRSIKKRSASNRNKIE
ncbi:hypothetical protein A3A09_02930 [Candidatus Nomurabacteria bacterium RIFCSPLOWO2_01_FULL_42_20]|uniref:Uncharacterized protein n=1 Tax=Candidatus Nomurabacteria bacterium RIFCSPHIGHO2_01_FULL_42_16 TaxID=1801743 RepID=A0A1F6VJ72_9BACT|nr:MAG: hypothetical protein A2824_03035 [Candidatus Nomurabacteria bacterium RIFCSPHIGHO2_01_FULL_42_16]OGI92561.1 MAG: hypothetical protein A3A09_02930 [Candidatus Nomurabacteria bacterium RIFCSPLOWO2_01_FULL_42_20]